MESRNRNRDNLERGKSLKEKLEAARLATTGVTVKAKEYCLGRTVFTHLRDVRDKKEEEARISAQSKRLTAIEHRKGFLVVMVINVALDKYKNKEFEDILKFVKSKYDGPIPKLKKDLWIMYQNLQTQSNLLMNYIPGAVQNTIPDPEIEADVNGDTVIRVQEECMVKLEVQVISEDENTKTNDPYETCDV